MKIRKTLLPVLMMLTVATSCSKDDDETTLPSDACFADAITLTETQKEDLSSSHSMLITFDAKNTSASDFDIQNGAKPVYVKVLVTTTDGAVYETNQILTVSKLSAGATTSTQILADYGAGKTYQSYKIDSKTCN